MPEYKSYQPQVSQQTENYRTRAKTAEHNSITGEPTRAKKQRRNTNNSKGSLARCLAGLLVVTVIGGAGYAAAEADIPERVTADFYHAVDNVKMIELADQFSKRFGIRTKFTDDHTGYYFVSDEFQDNLFSEVPMVTPNIVAATYVATGSTTEAETILNQAVAQDKFKGDPDATREMLKDHLKWRQARHKLAVDYKNAGEDLGKLSFCNYFFYTNMLNILL